MGLYPINLDLNDKPCTVIGGGKVAGRKAQALIEAGANVTLVSAEAEDDIRGLDDIEIINRDYKYGDLEDAFMAVAATSDDKVNALIAKEAKEKKVLLNIVDNPDLCDFYVPSSVKRGDLQISVSTNGRSPAFAKKLRVELEQEFGPEYEQYVDILGEARNKVIAKYTDKNKRKQKLQEIAYLQVVEDIKNGEIEKVKEKINSCI